MRTRERRKYFIGIVLTLFIQNLRIGVVESIEKDKKAVTKVYPKDGSVAVRIGGQNHVMFGRHFDETN